MHSPSTLTPMRRSQRGSKKPLSPYLLRQVAQGELESLTAFSKLVKTNSVAIDVDALDAIFSFFQKCPKSVDTTSPESLAMGPAALEELHGRLSENTVKLANWMEASVRYAYRANPDASSLERLLLSEILQGRQRTNRSNSTVHYIEGTVFDVPLAQTTLYQDIWKVISVVGQDPIVQRALCNVGYLASFTGTLAKLEPSFTLDDLLENCEDIVVQCFATKGNPVFNLEFILDSGYLEVLALNITGRELEDICAMDKKNVTFITRLEPYLFYPCISKALLQAKDRIEANTLQTFTTLPMVEGAWEGILNRARMVESNLKRMDEGLLAYPICDNNTSHEFYPKAIPKLCSNCHLVAYCSVECQREDWEKRHRVECNAMRCAYQDRCDRSIRYSQRLRAFHLRSIALAVTELYKELKDIPCDASTTEGIRITSVDLRFPVVSWKLSFSSIDVDEYLNEPVHGDCASIETRVRCMVQNLVDDPSLAVVLVEARLPWTNEKAVVHLTEMTLVQDAFVATQSVVQIHRKAAQLQRSLSDQGPLGREVVFIKLHDVDTRENPRSIAISSVNTALVLSLLLSLVYDEPDITPHLKQQHIQGVN
ncbi:hypothetical protein BKA70DRAFT_1481882 [Coprinopsis sp. MPI-PUGE-AT-0042]|nr:hypothetical protein BKA70DRAFT_1481882 [Coprinopsis sp. MPI-PUGE-AT-0042]